MSKPDDVPEYRIAPSNGCVGEASDPSQFRIQIRKYIDHRAGEGSHFVKTGEVADALDSTASRVGSNLSILADEGVVERWGGEASGVWRITLEDSNE